MPALPRRYRLAKRGRGIARRGGGEQFPGPVASRLPPAGCGALARRSDAGRVRGAVEGMATGATHIMRAHPVACRSAPSASGCGCAGPPGHAGGPAARKGSRVPPRKARQVGGGSVKSRADYLARVDPEVIARPGRGPNLQNGPPACPPTTRPPRLRARCRDPRR